MTLIKNVAFMLIALSCSFVSAQRLPDGYAQPPSKRDLMHRQVERSRSLEQTRNYWSGNDRCGSRHSSNYSYYAQQRLGGFAYPSAPVYRVQYYSGGLYGRMVIPGRAPGVATSIYNPYTGTLYISVPSYVAIGY